MPKKKKTKKDELLVRAKKAGLTDEQINKFPDKKSLKKYLDGISPATNPDSFPKRGQVKPPAPKKEVPNPIIVPMRPEEKRAETQDIMEHVRLMNIKYDNPGIVKATKVVVFDLENKKTESFYKLEVRK